MGKLNSSTKFVTLLIGTIIILCLWVTSVNAQAKLTERSKLALNGIGPIRVGMTVDEASRAALKLLECGKRNRLRGYGHQTLPVLVTVQPATPETRLLPELSSTTLRLENIRETTIAKQKAFVYIAKSSMTGKIDDAETSLSASFLTPDKRNKVTISTSNFGENISAVEEKVFNIVTSSFAFVI